MITITKPIEVSKIWGKEIIIDNNNEYCGKILVFKKGDSFSTHYHLLKKETWYILEGRLLMKHFNLQTAEVLETVLNVGDVIIVERGEPHKLTAILDSKILEVSTTHYDADSYRIEKGLSQQLK